MNKSKLKNMRGLKRGGGPPSTRVKQLLNCEYSEKCLLPSLYIPDNLNYPSNLLTKIMDVFNLMINTNFKRI